MKDIILCDACDNAADYFVDNEYYLCAECAEEFLKQSYDGMDMFEKAKALGVELEEL